MPRVKTISQSNFPYNITARTINKDWFKLSLTQVWDIFSEELYLTNKYFDLEVHSFVLMSNHFHLIASTPGANISDCMYYFMKNSSLRLTRAGNRINQTFCGRYYKTILQHHSYYLNAYKYNYLNPVMAGISTCVEDYPFSTLHGLLGKSRLLIPIVEDVTLFSSLRGTLSWLNEVPDEEKLEAVRVGLTKQYFKSKRCRKSRQLILGENDTL